jgi:hypothetical protein
MYICALFSGKYGWWNEEGTTDLNSQFGVDTGVRHRKFKGSDSLKDGTSPYRSSRNLTP